MKMHPKVVGFNTEDEMDKLLNYVIANYDSINNEECKLVSTTIDPYGKYLGCKVVWSPRLKQFHPITLLTEYGIIKIRSMSGKRLVKTVGVEMCAYFDRLALG